MLSTLALIMLTLVGYSSGCALAARPRQYEPFIGDLLTVVVLWVALFNARPMVGHWTILPLAVGAALITAYLITRLRGVDEDAMPDSELPEHAREAIAAAQASGNPLRRAWEWWKVFSAEMGAVQGRMLMGFFYFIIVTPFALALRLFGDPLNTKRQPAETGLVVREQEEVSLAAAQEQG